MALGKKTGGRRKGTPNKRTTELKRLISRHHKGFDPIIEMIKLYKDPYTPDDIKVQLLKEIAPYLYPKRKSLSVNEQKQLEMDVKHVVSESCGDPEVQKRIDDLMKKLTQDEQ